MKPKYQLITPKPWSITTILKYWNTDIIIRTCIIVLIILSSIVVRFFFLPYITGDYTGFLEPWMEQIAKDGLLNAYGKPLGDYFYPYLYLLGIGTLLPLHYLYSVKLISIVFDYIAAYLIFRVVKLIKPDKSFTAVVAGLSSLFIPTVILNGAGWAQSDIIFSTFILASLVAFIQGKTIWGVFWYAISFSFKLQAIFVLPVIALILAKKHIKYALSLLLIPIVYIISTIPAVLQGRNFIDALSIYSTQTGTYTDINLNGFGFYALVGGSEKFEELTFNWYSAGGDEVLHSISVDTIVGVVGTFAALGIVSIIWYALYHYITRFTQILYLEITLLFAFLVPFILPRMHERYWFLADILAFVYVFIKPKQWLVPTTIITASFISYITFMSSDLLQKPITEKWLPVFMLIPIYLIVKEIYTEIKKQI